MRGGEFFGECAVGGCQSGDGLAVVGGGRGKVGDGIDGVLLVGRLERCDGVGRLVSCGAGGDGFCLAELPMGAGKVSLEVGPCSLCDGPAFARLTIVEEHAGGEDELVCDGYHLCGQVGGEAGCRIIYTVFDLIEKCFDWQIWVIRGLEVGVVGL